MNISVLVLVVLLTSLIIGSVLIKVVNIILVESKKEPEKKQLYYVWRTFGFFGSGPRIFVSLDTYDDCDLVGVYDTWELANVQRDFLIDKENKRKEQKENG